MTKTILKATDICKIYDLGETKIHALKNVSLELFENDFLAIVGKSGSGKSTLMHILGLLDTPTSGELILKDKNVTKYTPNQLAHILPLKYSHVPKNQWEDKAKKMLEIVDLGDRLQNKSNELSGGQKQRVAIARALVNDPAIIFADEPTGNLDSKTGDEIVALFKKLHSQGKTIIIVTHDDDLAKIAERKIVLRDGIIV